MALDYNAMKAPDGNSLRHFTPWLTPKTAGQKKIAQNIAKERNPYVFPPFNLIFLVLCFLEEQKVRATIVVPKMEALPMWWTTLQRLSIGHIVLGEEGCKDTLLVPSRRGFIKDNKGLKWPLQAHRRDKEEDTIDWYSITERAKGLDLRMRGSSSQKRRTELSNSLERFLIRMSGVIIENCSPEMVRMFLIWKDSAGKTIVHDVDCPLLGSIWETGCTCPSRLASGTVEGLIYKLISLFAEHGHGKTWDIASGKDNPAASPLIKSYLKAVQEEQASAHILPKQAKPIFLTKLRAISELIKRELQRKDISLRERFVLFRDQAWPVGETGGGYRAGVYISNADISGLSKLSDK